MRPTISLAMIVKNERHNLPRLLKSVKGCFDEIHITDTGSNDGTIDYLRSEEAQTICDTPIKLHHFNWVDDFSKARNASFAPVKTDFVMWMDGDDVMSDRESFIRFRDDAMGLVDYWVAAYHYSLDDKGNPNCSFVRERIFRVSMGLQWRYFVHEGIVPFIDGKPISMNFIATWAIHHMRTKDDVESDRNRNLGIFERHQGELDGRMKYYYGKELFECGKPMDAYRWLKDALSCNLELHDKILATQYSCYAALTCNQVQESINLGFEGLKLDPNRAEFHVILGDSYTKLGQMQKAAPFYGAAKTCDNPHKKGSNAVGAIFTSDEQYNVYPIMQLSKIYAHMGKMDDADRESAAAAHFENHDINAINAEVKRIKKMTNNTSAKDCDDIVISCPPGGPYEWDGDLYKEKGMGGSETAAIEMAYWMKKKTGRPVKVFNTRQIDKTCDGVEYMQNSKMGIYFNDCKPAAHIAWRHNMKLTNARTYLWCHDLITPGAENHSHYEKMLCLSPFHKRYAMAMQGVPDDKIIVTRNGIKADSFFAANPKDQNMVIFPSSPDRGLDRAMWIMDRVTKVHPELKLHVYYGFDNLYKYGLASMADNLKKMAAERPYVVLKGFTPQPRLHDDYKRAVMWLHPANFIETFCITAIETLSAGCYPLTRRLGALQDTLAVAEKEGMATMLDCDAVTETELDHWANAFLDAYAQKRWQNVHVDPRKFSWESVATEWCEWLIP